QLSLRTGLLALLAFMTLLLLTVSFMGIVAINKGNRSLDVIGLSCLASGLFPPGWLAGYYSAGLCFCFFI
ncbi:hypothetical protein, partial [Pantoea agglomerans]|uniref:hypothetical protein n=1 Tax=Enterobacter agglomerans TaxID=549 RepID=UPI001A8D7B73